MAFYSTSTCIVCLKVDPESHNIFNDENRGIKLVERLQFVVPDQDWAGGRSICCKCEMLLNYSFEFKQLCINLESIRKSALKSEMGEIKYTNGESPSPIHSDNLPDIDEINQTLRETFTCFHCNKTFKYKHKLAVHISAKHALTCEHCRKSFTSKNSLHSHIKYQHREKQKSVDKFQCELCGEKFTLLKLILEHYVSVHSINRKEAKPYSCSMCTNRFASSANLIQHKSYHLGNRAHICSICGKTFITKSDLSVHESIHSNKRKFKCQSCDKTFNTNQNLRTHVLVVHTNPTLWKYSCPECLKRFPQKTNFEDHMKRHQNDRSFSCHVCSKGFISKAELRKHLKLHSNARPYKCTDCDKVYKDKRSMDIHLSRIHDPDLVTVKKFTCHVCSSQFFDRYKLSRHIRTHSRLKQFGITSIQCQ